MRTIKTIVLRFYLNTENPQQLCGDLQIHPHSKAIYFQNETALIGLLRQLATSTTSFPQTHDSPSDPNFSKTDQ